MPYIPKPRRIDITFGEHPVGPGELNYAITQLVRQYIDDHGLNYQTINDILGALDGAGKEFYRRVAAPYEDDKIQQNGDVYAPKRGSGGWDGC